MKLSIMFYPNKGKTSSKTGKIPMYLRLTLNRQKVESRLNIEIADSDMLKWNASIMRFDDRKMTANASLNTIDKNFEDFRHHNADKLFDYPLKNICNIIMGKKEIKASIKIRDYIDKYYKKAVAPNSEMADGTKTNYRKAIRHLNKFLEYRKSGNAELGDITIGFAYEFKDYLLGSTENGEKKSMTECSALGNIKRLRTIFDRAVEEGLMASNFLKKIKLKAKSAIRGRLDINQVKKIYKLNLTEFPTQQIYRDMFLFSVFTGLAYADAQGLKQTDVNLIKGDNMRLFLERAKTGIITEMILPKQATEIIERYRGTPEIQITKKVLPRRSNKEVNIQLKILANLAGISVKLSTHIARHTFRQLLAEADVFEMGIIKRMMGHSGGSEIDSVYYQVTESRLLEAKRKFELYLKKSLV